MYKSILDVVLNKLFLTGFLTGNVTGVSGTILGQKLTKVMKHKMGKRRKAHSAYWLEGA